jgi:predicted Zn-dependent protease
MRHHLPRPLLAAIAALSLAACGENEVTQRRQLDFVPDAALAQMADRAWDQLTANVAISRDPALNQRLARVAGPVVRAAGRDDLAWAFVIFDAPDLNAFVLPNGKVGVFRGMMDFAKSDDELAAVIGHEVAHILARHPGERASQELATQAGVTLAQLALGGENGENAELIGSVFGVGARLGVLLPYSRRHELEADRLGVDLVRKAGLDPGAAVGFWERMSASEARRGQPPEALSTHPADERRIAELKKAVAGGPAG